MINTIYCNDLLKKLHDAGVLPEYCRRVVLDIAYDDVAKVYFECFGDEKLLEVDLVVGMATQINNAEKKTETDEPKG